MSRRKDRERANQFIFRDGRYIPRYEWDKYQKELRELNEKRRLDRIGLIRGQSSILTTEEVMKLRRPIRRK